MYCEPIKNSFCYPFRPLFDRRPVERNRAVENGSKRSIKTVYWSAEGKTIFLKCLVLLNHPLEIVGQESVTSIDLYDEFYVNLLFDRFIHRPMCTYMGNSY